MQSACIQEVTMNIPASTWSHVSHQLRYSASRDSRRGLAFPCDANGRVDIDSLSEAARNDYFYARTVVGREFNRPCVQLNA
jgi:hypothetical protein